MQEKAILRQEIESTRKRLDDAMAAGVPLDEYYEISVELDKLIECYIDLGEREMVEV